MTDLDLLDLVHATRPNEDENDVYEEIEDGTARFILPSGVVEMTSDDAIALVTWLQSLITIGKSPFTGKIYKGFANGNMWLTKQEMKADDNS